MKQKCPTCNAGPDKDIFGMCSECGTINSPYEDYPEYAPHTARKRKSVRIIPPIIIGLLAYFVAEWLLQQPIGDIYKLFSMYCIGLGAAKIMN